MVNKKLFIPILIILCFAISPAFATDYTWTDGDVGNSDWSDPDNWDVGGSYPDGNDDVAIFDSTSNTDCDIDTDITVGEILLDTGYGAIVTQTGGNVIVDDAGGESGNLNVTAGKFDSNGYNITADGDAYVGSGSILETINSLLIELGSLTIATSGLYNASSTITTITSETSNLCFDVRAGGTFTHNNGLFKITNSGGCQVQDRDYGGIAFYDLEIASGGTNVIEFAGTNAPYSVANDLTITSGQSTFNANKPSLTVTGDIDIYGTLTGTNAQYLTSATLTLRSGGTYTATTGITTVTDKLLIYGGTYNAGSGTSNIDTDDYGDEALYMTSGSFNGNTSTLNIGSIYTTGGVFTSTSGRLHITRGGDSNTISMRLTAGSQFVHNNGEVFFEWDAGNNQMIHALYSGTVTFYDLTIGGSASVRPYYISYPTTIVVAHNMTIENDGAYYTRGTVSTGSGYVDLTVTGNLSIAGDFYGMESDVSAGSISISGTGVCSATSGTTVVTSINGNSRYIESDGTFTHNDGLIYINTSDAGILEINGDNVYNLQLYYSGGSTSRIWNDAKSFTVDNDLTLDDGLWWNYAGSDTLDLTVLGTTTINSGATLKNYYNGDTDHDAVFSILDINTGGIYEATDGITNITSGFDLDGTYTEHSGSLYAVQTIAGNVKDTVTFVELEITNTGSVTVDDTSTITVGSFDLNNTLTINDNSIFNITGSMTFNGGYLELYNGSMYNADMEGTVFDVMDAIDLGIYPMLTYPSDLPSYVNIDRYLNVTTLGVTGSASCNITYDEGTIISWNVNEESIQIWKYTTGWTQTGVSDHFLDTTNNIVGATISGITGFTVIAPLGSATTVLLGYVDLSCDMRFKYVACTFFAQDNDAEVITNATVDWDIAYLNGSSIYNGTFSEIYNGTYVMDYSIPTFPSDFLLIVASLNDKIIARPLPRYDGIYKIMDDILIHVS